MNEDEKTFIELGKVLGQKIYEDKIKAKIDELDKYITECEYMDHEEWLQAVAKIHFLQDLLEEE